MKLTTSKLESIYAVNPQFAADLLTTFNQFFPITKEELLIIMKNASLVRIPKKTTILKIGQTCGDMYYILSGCLRLYYQKDIMEINSFFFHEGLFCTAFGSFMMQRPSNQIMETLEDTVALRISFQELQNLYVELPKMNALVRKIVEERYSNAHDIISSYVLDTPEERYLKYKDRYPKLVNRIPEYHVASYLGITPKSLSRLKKRVYKNAKK